MDTPRLRKRWDDLLGALSRWSRSLAVGVGLFTLAPGQSPPVLPSGDSHLARPSKFSGKYLLRRAHSGLARFVASHRSHASHSSHASHASHASHYSGTSTPSTAPAPPSPPPVSTPPARRHFRETFTTTSGLWSSDVMFAGAADPLVPVHLSGGQLQITPRKRVTGHHFGGYVSATTWDLTNGRIQTGIAHVPSALAKMAFGVGRTNNWYGFKTYNDKLWFVHLVNGVQSGTAVPLRHATQRYWRLTFNASTKQVMWETSADGVWWNQQYAESGIFDVSDSFVELSAGTDGSVATPGTAAFDSVESTPIQ